MGKQWSPQHFITNWREYDAPLLEKLRLLARNRTIATAKGCCGHPGEPGC
jgi:hypothetical protein